MKQRDWQQIEAEGIGKLQQRYLQIEAEGIGENEAERLAN